MPKNWCLWTVVLKKTPESPLDSKDITPINTKGNQLWIFTGRTNAEAEAPIFVHLMWLANTLEKTLVLEKIEGRRRRRWQDEMVGWYHWLNGHELEQTLGDSEGQRSLAYYTVHGVTKRHDWATELNWTSAYSYFLFLKKTFIYFIIWLCWVFAARKFPLVAVSKGYSLLQCTSSHCGGFLVTEHRL